MTISEINKEVNPKVKLAAFYNLGMLSDEEYASKLCLLEQRETVDLMWKGIDSFVGYAGLELEGFEADGDRTYRDYAELDKKNENI